MEKRYYLSCNQLEHRWEVRRGLEEIAFTGTIEECKKFLDIVNEI